MRPCYICVRNATTGKIMSSYSNCTQAIDSMYLKAYMFYWYGYWTTKNIHL